MSKNTDNITHVVDLDLEEYDFSTDQVHNSFNNKNINGHDTSNITAKIGNSDKENSSVSGQNKNQSRTSVMFSVFVDTGCIVLLTPFMGLLLEIIVKG
jgi:hypothetical protein